MDNPTALKLARALEILCLCQIEDCPCTKVIAAALKRAARNADAAASVSADFLRHGRDQHVGEAILAALRTAAPAPGKS